MGLGGGERKGNKLNELWEEREDHCFNCSAARAFVQMMHDE